jgi:hypothetical protein
MLQAWEPENPRPRRAVDLGGSQREVLRREQQNLATGLDQSALSLPMAEEAAGGEMCDIGSLGQLFIGDIQFHSCGDPVPDAFCQVNQNRSKALRRRVAGEGHMSGNIKGEKFCGGDQYVIQQSRVAYGEAADGGPVPDKEDTIFHGFRTDNVVRWPALQCRASDYFSYRQPHEHDLLAFRRQDKKTRAASDQYA